MTDEAIKAVSNLDLMVNPLLNMPARFSRDTWKKMILKGLNRTFMFSPTSFAAYAVLFGLEDMSELDDMIEELKGKAFRRFDFPPPPGDRRERRRSWWGGDDDDDDGIVENFWGHNGGRILVPSRRVDVEGAVGARDLSSQEFVRYTEDNRRGMR